MHSIYNQGITTAPVASRRACGIGGERRWAALAVGLLRLPLVRLALQTILQRHEGWFFERNEREKTLREVEELKGK